MKPTRILAGLMLAVAVSGSVQATTLSTLISGGSVTAGDKLFDNWSVISFATNENNRNFNAANIDVSALNDGGLEPGPGLRFSVSNGELNVVGPSSVELTFGFRASVLNPGLKIKDSSLEFTSGGAYLSWIVDGSNDNGNYVRDGIGTAIGLEDLAVNEIEFSLEDDLTTSVLDDSSAFAPLSEVWITKTILVRARDTTDGAGLFGFEQRFSQTSVPEPATLLLLGLGLAGLGFSRARLR